MANNQIELERFILKQIIRQDVRYMPDTCCFEHIRLTLSDVPAKKQAIFDEGHTQGYSDDTIQYKIYSVINSPYKHNQREKRPVLVSIKLNSYQHLSLGGIVAISATTKNHQNCLLQLLRTGLNDFIAIESSEPEIIRPSYNYTLVNADFLSTMDNATFTFSCKETGDNIFISRIHDLSIVQPSNIESVLDEDKEECGRKRHVLHKNPMAILLHEYSNRLQTYIDLEVHQKIFPAVSNNNADDLTLFAQQIRATVYCYNTVTDIESYYLQWLSYCHTNGISVMTLDSLLNLFWQHKINNSKI